MICIFHKRTELAHLISLVLLSGFGLNAQAQNAGTAPSAMKEVVVLASRNDTALEDMPTHTTVITQEDIQKSPAQTLDQLLRSIPGFNFSGAPSYLSDPTGTQTKIRGLGNAKVLVLLDGIPIMDPFYLTTQWFRVPLSTVDHIEIMRGGASSLWGSMAVGGVVNIITKTPKDGSAEISASAGSFGTSNLAASKNVVVSDALSLNFSVNRMQTNGYQTTPAQYTWLYPDKHSPTDLNAAYQASAYFKPSADLHGFLRLGYFTQNQDLYGAYGTNLQKSPDLSGGLTKKFGDGASLDGKLWAQSVEFNKTNGASCYQVSSNSCLNGGSSTLPTATQAANSPIVNYYSQYGAQTYTERGVSTTYSKPLNRIVNNIQFGADYRQLSVNDLEQYYTTPTAANQQNLTGTATGTGTQTFAGAFVQTKISPVEPLQITLSGRYDSWSNSNRSYSLNTTAHGMSPGSGPAANTSKNQFDPTLGVHYDANDQLAFRGSAYKAFRAPGLNNQTRSYGTSIANPNLEPETVVGWELGSDYKSAKLDLGVTYYANNISNMIATSSYTTSNTLPQPVINLCSTAALGSTPNLTNCGSSVSFYSNDQNGKANGVELTGKYKPRDNLTIDAFYSYTSTYLTSEWNGVTTPLHTQLVGVPKNTFSLSGTWKPVNAVTAYLQMYYIGALSYYQSSSAAGIVNDKQGSNTVFNASLNYQFDKATDLFANVVNLFNRQYQDGSYTASQPQGQTLSPPRTLTLGFRHRFD